MPDRPLYTLYPSDLTWLYADCPRCFYLKLRHRVWRPDGGFPGIFSKIDSAIKKYCLALERTELVCPDMPPGRFVLDAPKSVQSCTFSLDGRTARFELAGKPDTIIQWDDGSYAVIDFKTSAIREQNVAKYGDQLEMYACALEKPAPGKAGLEPISSLGLLVWEPSLFDCLMPGEPLRLEGQLAWIPVARRHDELKATLAQVMQVLDGEGPPQAGVKCKFCAYPGKLGALAV